LRRACDVLIGHHEIVLGHLYRTKMNSLAGSASLNASCTWGSNSGGNGIRQDSPSGWCFVLGGMYEYVALSPSHVRSLQGQDLRWATNAAVAAQSQDQFPFRVRTGRAIVPKPICHTPLYREATLSMNCRESPPLVLHPLP
jgi:hypothetical protein